MGISATFLTTGAGLFKLLDPVWQSGLGFYYSMNIPFFSPKHLWPMLDNKWLVITLNWVTIIAEFIAFPLFIFRRTRLFGILGVAGLGLFLSYPMAGIGIVGGPIVIVLAITLSTLIERDNFFFGILNKVGIFLRQLSLNIRSFDFVFFTNSWMKYIIFLWTFSGVLFWTIKRIPNIVYKPPVFGSFINTKPPVILIPDSIQYRLGMTTKVLEKTRPHRHFEFIWLLDLFDYPHLFDRVIFKVEFNLKDAGVVEPRKFFNENGSYSNDYPLLFNERFLLTCWRIMEFYQGGGTDSNDLTPGQRNEILALIRYCAEKLERDVFESATISIKGLYQPKEYTGNKKSWEDKDWLPFIRYESDKKKLEVLNTLARYNFSQLEIDSFKKEILVPKYE